MSGISKETNVCMEDEVGQKKPTIDKVAPDKGKAG